MSYHKGQFKSLIESVLKDYDLYSESATNLLMGTAAQESRFGHFLKQLGKGPALGPFQIEPETYEWLRRKYGKKYGFSAVPASRLQEDLRLSILVCRLRYLVVREPLPEAGNLQAMAKYWKRWYNTADGKGTVAEFISNWKRHVEKPL